MSPEDNPNGNARLSVLLRRVADTAQVAAALGIEDVASQDEEFWQGQRRAALKRFFTLCLAQLGWDLATEQLDLDSGQAHLVADEAEALLEDAALQYADIRRWFHNRGQFEYNAAVQRRRESARLSECRLRVLLVLEAGGAKYLAYGPKFTDIRLVDKAEEAFAFPVKSVSELEAPYLTEMARHFDHAVASFGVRQVKVLVGRKT